MAGSHDYLLQIQEVIMDTQILIFLGWLCVMLAAFAGWAAFFMISWPTDEDDYLPSEK